MLMIWITPVRRSLLQEEPPRRKEEPKKKILPTKDEEATSPLLVDLLEGLVLRRKEGVCEVECDGAEGEEFDV